MQCSSIAIADLHGYIAHTLRISEHFSWHGRHAGIIQTEVKMGISHTLKNYSMYISKPTSNNLNLIFL